MEGADKIDLKGSMVLLIALSALFGVYKLVLFIYLLVTGATANVASSGNIIVPTVINDTINSTVQSVADGYDLINAADPIILGLIGLVVILKVFWPIIGPYMQRLGKKNKSY